LLRCKHGEKDQEEARAKPLQKRTNTSNDIGFADFIWFYKSHNSSPSCHHRAEHARKDLQAHHHTLYSVQPIVSHRTTPRHRIQPQKPSPSRPSKYSPDATSYSSKDILRARCSSPCGGKYPCPRRRSRCKETSSPRLLLILTTGLSQVHRGSTY